MEATTGVEAAFSRCMALPCHGAALHSEPEPGQITVLDETNPAPHRKHTTLSQKFSFIEYPRSSPRC